MGSVIVKQYICCKSYVEAVEISKSYEGLRIMHFDLERRQTIVFKRQIRKYDAKSFSHMLIVYFHLKCSDFSDYGYIDSDSLKRYPELPQCLREASNDERFEILTEYRCKSDEYFRDLIYYRDFNEYFEHKLQGLLNKIALVAIVALAGCSRTNFFGIQYEEKGQWYERGYFAYDSYTPFDEDESWLCEGGHCLKMSDVWRWMQSAQKMYRWEDKNTDIPITALSYVMNRMPGEQLIYSVIGLESIYVSKNQKKKKERLKLLLPQVCPGICQEDVEDFYSLRSDLVHGDLSFPEFRRAPYHNYESKYTMPSLSKAGVALIMTIRALVRNNAFCIRNNGTGGIRYMQTEKNDCSDGH